MFAEFAMVAVERTKLDHLAEEGDKRARSARTALRTLSFQLSGAQLGITITSLIVGFLAEPTIGAALEPWIDDLSFVPERSTLAVSVTLALLLATAIEMVIAELIPKNYAIAKPLETSLALATPLRLFNTLFRPLIVFLNASANWTVRRLGIEPREELAGVRSLDELGLLIKASHEQGSLATEEASMLARSIGFGDKTAADALLPRTALITVNANDTLAHMASVALETGLSRFPVVERDLDDVTGTAHIKDIYRYSPDERAGVKVKEVVKEILVIPESRPLDSLLLEMRRERRQIAVVVDEYGSTAGIVTLEDLLEEIVGAIEDEYDPREAGVHLTSPSRGIHVVSGMLRPDEVREQTGFTMPDGEYETLAGFLLFLFDRIPDVGDHVSHDDWEFKVVEMDKRRVARVLMVAPSEEAPRLEDEG